MNVPCPRCGTACLIRRVYRDPDASFDRDTIYNVCCPVCAKYRTMRMVQRKFQDPEWEMLDIDNHPQWIQVYPRTEDYR